MHLKTHKVMQQGCVFFHHSHAMMTSWAQIFNRFVILMHVGIHQVRVFDIYQLCPVALMTTYQCKLLTNARSDTHRERKMGKIVPVNNQLSPNNLNVHNSHILQNLMYYQGKSLIWEQRLTLSGFEVLWILPCYSLSTIIVIMHLLQRCFYAYMKHAQGRVPTKRTTD